MLPGTRLSDPANGLRAARWTDRGTWVLEVLDVKGEPPH